MKYPTNSVFLFSLATAGLVVSAPGCGSDFTCEDSLSCDRDGTGNGDGAQGGDGGAAGGQGGQGGDSAVTPPKFAPVELTDDEIPDAGFNEAFSFELEATGEGVVTISVDASTLPEGLTFSADDNMISGTPLEDGVFEIKVILEDEEGQTKTVTLELLVTRKKWLAFVSIENNSQRLKLVDYTADTLSQIVVSTGMSATSDIRNGIKGSFGFSQDGGRIGYLADKGTDDEYSLYAVELTSAAPSGDVKISGDGTVAEFAWAPNGERVAYIEDGTVHIYDFPSDIDHTVGDAFAQLAWLNDNLLTYAAEEDSGTIGYTRWQDSAFTLATTVSTGHVSTTRLNASKGMVGQYVYVGDYCPNVDAFVDFSDGADLQPVDDVLSRALYSPDWGHVADVQGISPFTFTLVSPDAPTSIRLSEPANYPCALWSANSRWALYVDGNSAAALANAETTKLHTTGLEKFGVSLLAGTPNWGGFTSDSRWLIGTSTANGGSVQAVSISGEVPGAIQPISTGSAIYNSPSPNGKFVVYLENTSKELRLVGLEGSTPEARRVVSAAPSTSVFQFSSDSAALAYKDANFENLYIVDLMNETGIGRKVTTFCSATCTDDILAMQFQP